MIRPMNTSGMHHHCRAELENLRALDFAIQETVLYLNAYPDNRQALDYYHQLLEQREQCMTAYENNCGPLTIYGNTDKTSWNWIKGPWPWESDAN